MKVGGKEKKRMIKTKGDRGRRNEQDGKKAGEKSKVTIHPS